MDFKVENIGTYLKEKRKEENLTLNEVAKVLNLSAGYISRIERGTSNPSKEVLVNLCDIYKIPVNELIDNNGEITLENIKVGTDILTLVSSSNITYKGESIGVQDRMNIGLIIKTLLDMTELEDKNNFVNIINNVNEIIVRKN